MIDGLPTRIRLLEPLGGGATATVWRARDTAAGRDVAVKVVAVDRPPGDGAERFEVEVRALARLRGVPGVLGVRECGIGREGSAWFVSDLATGGSLADRLRDDVLDEEDALATGVVLAGALATAHERGVVHGDISPANVLYDGDGSPLLADFGMAALDGRATGLGITPAFTPPERLRGAPPSAAADVFSLAATLAAAVRDADGLPSVVADCLAERPAARPGAAALARALGEEGRRRR